MKGGAAMRGPAVLAVQPAWANLAQSGPNWPM